MRHYLCGITPDMNAAGTHQPWLDPENKPLLLAALISVVVHALAFWLLVVLALASVLFSPSKREALAEMLRTQAARARTPPDQEPQLVFVQVDPSQATPDAPKDAKYYSAQNSRAANPDADSETGVPKIDGTQQVVPKTEDTPRQKAFPLQPSPPKQTPPPEKPEDAKPAQPPGDLAMLNPAQNKQPETPQIAPERPHTLAEARLMAGDKMKEDGGVKRSHVTASLDAIGSPFGEYDARVINAIEQHWYDLIDTRNNYSEPGGRVVVQFRLHYDGRVSDLQVIHSDVGELLSSMCVSAINDPAPYDRWPEPMYRRIKVDSGLDYREVQFTFFYEW
jgi:outer membrane biosynthesis protein TonB